MNKTEQNRLSDQEQLMLVIADLTGSSAILFFGLKGCHTYDFVCTFP